MVCLGYVTPRMGGLTIVICMMTSLADRDYMVNRKSILIDLVSADATTAIVELQKLVPTDVLDKRPSDLSFTSIRLLWHSYITVRYHPKDRLSRYFLVQKVMPVPSRYPDSTHQRAYPKPGLPRDTLLLEDRHTT